MDLKIAFLSYGYGKDNLGIGKYSWYLVNELRKLGVDIDVFTTNLRFKSFGPPLFYLRNMFLNLKNYDLVHSNEGAGVFIYHPCMVETYHHDYEQTYDINSLVFHKLEVIHCYKVRHIIVPSFSTKKSLIYRGFNENKISVIPHGVDFNIFKKDEQARVFLRKRYDISDCFVVMNVGQLIRRKKQEDIIKALHGIPNIVFILVGRGGEEENLKTLASKLRVKLIHFKYVPESFLADLYNAADVYVHTSIIEGFGLTILEAMACGLPVVVYETADFQKIINDSGFVLKQGDIAGLSEKIELLQEDEKMRRHLSENALRQSKKFVWKESALKHLKVYEEILESN
jgi:glycosyltransferase involved in cell wall biosynthesis